MSAKRSLTIVVTGTVLLLICFSSREQASPAFAQCGNPPPSSCTSCHAQQDPVENKGEWHVVHASKDICTKCHGGNASTMDKDLAHQGMTANPLSDIYTDCHSCHPDYIDRAAPYAATLQVTPSSCATPTAAAIGNVSNGMPPKGTAMQSNLMGTSTVSQVFLFITGGLTLLVLFCISACWLGEHHVKS
jgi:hypothetical protein